jgi:multiple sugar transport system substrate-binding protein
MIELKGITWDHPRGFAPLVAASREYEARHGVRVVWDKRSLKEFGDADLRILARDYDLLVIDHPHVGEATESGCLLPLDKVSDPKQLDRLRQNSTGPSYSSYHYNGRQWALPLDAACQVSAYRPDMLDATRIPDSWEQVFELAACLRAAGLWMGMALCPTDTLCSFLTLTAQLGDPPVELGKWIQRDTTFKVLDHLARLRDASHPDSMQWNPIALYDKMSGGGEIAYTPLAFGYITYVQDGFRPHRLVFTSPPGSENALLGGAGLAVSSQTPHPEIAAAYCQWVCGSCCQATIVLNNGGQPANLAAWRPPSDHPASRSFLQSTLPALENAYVRPRFPAWPAFQEALGERVHAFLKTDGNPGRLHDELEGLYMETVLNHETV